MNQDVLHADSISEDLKKKAVVQVYVFADEVDPEIMPKPRHICISKFQDDKWVTRKAKNNNVVSHSNHDMFMFRIINSGMFIAVNDEKEDINEAVNMLESQIK